ncbi:MAG: hypothetical protein MAG795_00732 [Candidatus Woesearchaeota archaeon]|nr:hypothetical protein [Candidatus Woesearchaeota archaeon]
MHDVYSKQGLKTVFDDDSLSAGEYAFMRGYLDAA